MNKKNHSLNDNFLIKEVNELNEFNKLKVEWDKLAQKQGKYTPFLCFDWFKIWSEHFLKDDKLLILLVYEGDQLVAIAPFLLLREKFNSISVKKIELIGNIYSPIRNFIFNDLTREEKTKCLLHLFSFLFNDLNGWDIIELCPVLEDDETMNILKSIIRERGYQNWSESYAENWYMNGIKCSSFDEYFNRRPHPDFKKSFRKRKKRFEESGKVEFKMVRDDKGIDEYMDCYYEVYARSWKEREAVGPMFHRDLGRVAAAKGWLRLGFLFLNGVPVATHFCIVSNKAGYFLKVAYDGKYKEYGLGHLMHYETIRYMIDYDRIESMSLGAGNEDYKKFWVSDKREMQRIVVFNKTSKGNCLAVLNNNVLPTIRKNRTLNRIKNYLVKQARHYF